MRWNVKIEYKPADDVYEYVVTPEITPELAQRLLELHGDKMSPYADGIAGVVRFLPRLNGVATTRESAAGYIKEWILVEEAKNGVKVFEEVIDLG